jgi:hypothetical protein
MKVFFYEALCAHHVKEVLYLIDMNDTSRDNFIQSLGRKSNQMRQMKHADTKPPHY